MPKQKPNNPNNPGQGEKEGYLIIPNYFLREWVKVLGIGPALLYLELLSYCYKGKDIAWPTLDSLCQQMGIAKTTLLRYQNILMRFGLIKNIKRGKFTTGNYKNNVYQITTLEELTKHPGKIIDFLGSKMKPDRHQNDTCIGSNLKLPLVSKRYPNNNNINNTNTTTTKAVVVVDFKKFIKAPPAKAGEEGEEKIPAIKERLEDLDLKEEFIEQLLKDYPPGKIEEKLDLLLNQRNIHYPVGWLVAALKKDYQEPQSSWSFPQEQESTESPDEESMNQDREAMHPDLNTSRGINPSSTKNLNTPNCASREKALKAIRQIRNNLSLPVYPPSPPGRELK